MSVRITCISKDNAIYENPHEAITFLGWVNEKTKVIGNTSRIEMYNWIKEKGGEAYVSLGTEKVSILGTAMTAKGVKYLRTYANGFWNDDLLSLPECKK